MIQEKYAIIDIGSNTMRLVIYKRDRNGTLKEIENIKVVARLRNFLSEEGVLEPIGITKLIKTLQGFQGVTSHHQLEEVKCVGTATIRQAKNKEEILERVKNETDFTMQVLTAYEEAYYGFIAVVHSTPYEKGVTVDIGGGSTEVTYFENRNLIHYHSFPFGVLSLKKQFIKGDIPEETELKKLRQFLQEQFGSLKWLYNIQTPLISIGGSARNIVQIHQEYIDYPIQGIHQYVMGRKDIKEINNHLLSMSFSELQRVEGLSKDRTDIIIPAIEAFATLMDTMKSEIFALSQKGLREGLLYDKSKHTSKVSNILEESIQELAVDFKINVTHVSQVTESALIISHLLNREGFFSMDEQDIKRIEQGSFLYNLGSYIDIECSSQHTFYLLANRSINGMHHKERIVMALIASFKNKESFKHYLKPFNQWFEKEEIEKIRLIGSIIKFAYSLHVTKRNIIDQIDLHVKGQELVFFVSCLQDRQPEAYQVEKQKKHLEKQLNRSISVNFSH
ncbi:MAG TPA: Ppx/GppA family phosphatase [Bacillus bacterium]|nr:Ppx/GppA family phosphatase [Bacillus sp. (in: firmicutes)]